MAVSCGRQCGQDRDHRQQATPSVAAAPKQGAKQLLTAQIHNVAVPGSLMLATYGAMQALQGLCTLTPTLLCCWCCMVLILPCC